MTARTSSPPFVESPDRTAEGESQLRQSGDTELATLAGGLAHEIRNPLSTIRMNVELLREDLAELDDPRAGRMLKRIERIQRECLQLDDILGAFLQFARVGELELVEEDLGRVVSEFIRFYEPEAQRAGIELRPRIAADLPPVRIDERLFRQVLMNLALNAQQAMPQGGLLELLAYERDGHVWLDVIDTGCGIETAQQRRIFDAFFSTKPNGSGLGLPTVRRIVEAHGGTIACQSEKGRGSRFTICLPAA
jgi:two-component system, NtrC family, sensor histidine kinase HydH